MRIQYTELNYRPHSAAITTADYWGEDLGGEEPLRHTDIESAIFEMLDGRFESTKDMPEFVEVSGWRRMSTVGHLKPGNVTDQIIEELDEEFGGPDGPSPHTDKSAIEKAAAEFISSVEEHYHVWGCSPFVSVVVNTQDWIKENEPQWLDGAPR